MNTLPRNQFYETEIVQQVQGAPTELDDLNSRRKQQMMTIMTKMKKNWKGHWQEHWPDDEIFGQQLW